MANRPANTRTARSSAILCRRFSLYRWAFFVDREQRFRKKAKHSEYQRDFNKHSLYSPG